MKGQWWRCQLLCWADQNEVPFRPSLRQLKKCFDIVRASFHFTHQIYVRYSHWLLLNQFPFPHRQLSVSCNQESGSHNPLKLLLSTLPKKKKKTMFITIKQQVPGLFCTFLLSLNYIKWSNISAGNLRRQMDFLLNSQLRWGSVWMLVPMTPHYIRYC